MTDEKRGLPPSYSTTETDDPSPRIVDITSEDADLVFDALSSSTARRIYQAVSDDPSAPPELAERLDLSLQNVHYHLRNLQDADLIEEVGTGYSEKGVEMSVYGPVDDPIVLSSGDEADQTQLRGLLKRGSGAVVVLGVLSLGVQWAVTQGLPEFGDQPAPAPAPTPVPRHPPTVPTTPTSTQPVPTTPTIPPGIMFFVGGVVMLVLGFGFLYNRSA